MKKIYDSILFDKHGQSISLSTDEFIEYLLHNLHTLRCERDSLKKQLDNIRLILDLKTSNLDF